MTTTWVADRRLVGLLRTTDCGRWYLTVDRAGALGGGLLFDPALVRDPVAAHHLAAAVGRVSELGLPGVLAVSDLVVEDGAVWLLTAVAPGPTVGEFLDDGPARGLNAGSAATLLNETAQMLAALHAQGIAHGALGPSTVLIGPDGKAALAEVSLGVALGVRRVETLHDVRAWARLAAQLARGWASDDIQGTALLGQAAATAEVDGLENGRYRLIDGRAILPARFLERAELITAANAWSVHMSGFAHATGHDRGPDGSEDMPPAGRSSPRSLLTSAGAAPARSDSNLATTEAQPRTPAPAGYSAPPPRWSGEPVGAGPGRSFPAGRGASGAQGMSPGPAGVETYPGREASTPWREPPASGGRKGRRLPLLLIAFGLVAALAAAAGVVYLRSRPPDHLTVNSVEVQPPDKAGCNSTVDVVGVIHTNGGSGDVRYRWVRNDDQSSQPLVAEIPANQKRTELTLRWTFEGKGTFPAEATLRVLAPTTKSATGRFTYECK